MTKILDGSRHATYSSARFVLTAGISHHQLGVRVGGLLGGSTTGDLERGPPAVPVDARWPVAPLACGIYVWREEIWHQCKIVPDVGLSCEA